ncbi:uncharacterized protein LOC107474947 [Arachis duranensis]|uniref:Uncharacterized protein LOC107474947 n=1 Tax=Arachis duranensis TaxID=130453 RepID=A0A9C6TR57_ARADU|nr:uncharacterized protein LOC107474947 [Arachis duranensis]
MGAVKEGGRSRAVVLAVGASMAVRSYRCPTSCNRGCLLSCMAAEEVVVAAGTTTGATGYFCRRRKVCRLQLSRFEVRRGVGSAVPPLVRVAMVIAKVAGS